MTSPCDLARARPAEGPVSSPSPVLPAVGTDLSVSVLGDGLPVTVFAHGIGGAPSETRPLAQRVAGTRVLLAFRGHGDSPDMPGGQWDYDHLADDLIGVADAYGATRAVGLSLGAGALLRVLARDPDRFDRIAFALPAALDAPRPAEADERIEGIRLALVADDLPAVVALLLDDVPPQVRTRHGAVLLAERRARALLARHPPTPRGAVRPLTDLGVLAAVSAPALVLAQQDDPVHPQSVAEALAAALPNARLQVLPPGGLFWSATREAQDALADHLA